MKYYQREKQHYCQGNNKSTYCTSDRGTSANLMSLEEAQIIENINIKKDNPINKQARKIQKSNQNNDTPILSTSDTMNVKKEKN